MFSSRLSNRSSLSSRLKENQITEPKVINSSEYLEHCKIKNENYDQLIYDSLNFYQKQIKILKGLTIVYESKVNFYTKLNALKDIKQFSQKISLPKQPLTQQELQVFKPIFKTQKKKQCQQFSEILEKKQQQQRKAQQQFIKSITEQYEEDKKKQMIATVNFQRIFNRKLFKKYQQGLNSLSGKRTSQKPNEKIIKNILTSTFMMISIKIKFTQQMAFKTLLKQFGMGSIVDQLDTNLKTKGKALMALKQYPRLNLKRAFWRWHLSTTDQGQKLFKRASDKLVLYTNINKTTFFYRLYNQVRAKQIKVDPKIKRMTLMFYLYTKIYFQRPMRTFFEKTKILTANSGKQFEVTQNIIRNSQLRQKDLFNKWLNKAKQIKEKQKEKKAQLQNLAQKIIEVSQEKKKFLIEGWKKATEAKLKSNKLREYYLKKLLFTKTGRIVQAFNIWKKIPKKFNLQGFKKISLFQQGLVNFAQRTLKRALKSFQDEYQKGQLEKKKAVIQMISITQGGQKRYFNKWKNQVLEHSLYRRCEGLSRMFQHIKKGIDKNLRSLYEIRKYNPGEILILQNCLAVLQNKKCDNVKKVFNRLKQHVKQSRFNKWFYRSAQCLALRSHVTVHKSFLRLKYNVLSKVQIQDKFSVKQKLGRLCCTMKKYYKLVVYRAFVTMQKWAKSQQKGQSQITRNTNSSQFTYNQSTLKQESVISVTIESGQQSGIQQQISLAIQKASVNLCENVFNQNLRKQMKRWRYAVWPQKQFSQSHQILLSQYPDLFKQIQKSKSAIKMTLKISTKRLLKLSLGFRSIIEYVLMKKSSQMQEEQDQNLEQRLQLITKQNALMQKIEEYKKQNEALIEQLEVKEGNLLQSNKMVTILSLRINYMVMQKFVSLVEKVVDNNIWRSMNEGFDCIIETANQNFQKQQEMNDEFDEEIEYQSNL